ncbi:ethanolamine utilization protein EutJ [Loigolactobacillus zhaoyuanensis]|uniref:ethanolamine utilization protein EutJ n=1 Tax=Loigolactobacillus zhaoyuanensis TaxID=2486017 RepID=UPI000F73BEEA|nr:ethanolamine utilization protein EutJ [Loigolactobacillus zhaoyuanensis]
MDDNQELINCNRVISQFESTIQHPVRMAGSEYFTGVDLGTACIVLSVMDRDGNPVAGAYQYANVVRDGMVVDYIGAIDIVRKLKTKLEADLQTTLVKAAAAIPPGTNELDSGAIKNVVQGADFDLVNLLDEPTAANQILQVKNGAIVDIGGGTTGIAILKDGRVIKVADEATGGTHMSLVIAGAYKKSFQEAEEYKRQDKNHKELLPVLKPVIEKVSSIIAKYISNEKIDVIYLVGGTCCLAGIETIIEQKLGIMTVKPNNPMFVTPLGIAASIVPAA